MRVVHVVGRVDDQASGPTLSVTSLAAGLARSGEDVVLHAMGAAPPPAERPYELKIHPKWSPFGKLWISPSLKAALFEEARQSDVLHNHGLWHFGNVYPAGAVRGTNCRLVTSPRGALSPYSFGKRNWLKRLFWNSAQKGTVLEAHCLHATAPSELESWRALGINLPVAVIPNGIHVPPPSNPNGRPVNRELLFLGRLHRGKGLERLLQAWLALSSRFPDWTLRIVGPDDHSYARSIKKYTQDLGLKRVSFSGALFGAEKQMAFESADLFVLPSDGENFGMAVAEALASGLPAIVSTGAPWSGLRQNGCGWWVDLSKEGELSRALEEAMSSPRQALIEMGQRGRQWMLRDFSWDAIALQMKATYAWLLGEGSKPDWVRS